MKECLREAGSLGPTLVQQREPPGCLLEQWPHGDGAGGVMPTARPAKWARTNTTVPKAKRFVAVTGAVIVHGGGW
jgi:hypothetical protein